MKPSRTPRPTLTAHERFTLHRDCPMCGGTCIGDAGMHCPYYGNGGRAFKEPERVEAPVGRVSSYKEPSTDRRAVYRRAAIVRRRKGEGC